MTTIGFTGVEVNAKDELVNGKAKADVQDVSVENEEHLGGTLFDPPLFIQRYYFVAKLLEKFSVKHIVDFGSAECKIARFLVQLPTVENIDLVDLNGNLLRSKLHAIRPLTCDYLDKRDKPLHVRMLQGSVTDLDVKIVGCDAVSMVEIIEHLNPDILEGAVDMVFRQLQPSVVVVTTPNSEFNQLFPNFSGMRHWDHKFEWTRKEMQTWCEEICQCHPYTVEYGGIGDPPADYKHLGNCSQYAVFIRDETVPKIDFSMKALDKYVIISESSYPYKEKILSDEEIILAEIKYQIRQYKNPGSSFQCGDVWKQDSSQSKGNRSIGQFPGSYSLVCSNFKNYVYESDVDSGIQSVFHPEQNQPVSCDKLQYCVNCSRIRMEKMSQQFIPIKFLMNRTIRTKMEVEQLQTFLRKHGYRLSADCFYIVVDSNNGDNEDQDEISEDLYDDEDDAVNEYLNSLQTTDDINDIQSNLSLQDTFGTEQWD